VSAGGPVCLVTGASGFVGRHVVRRLVADGRYAVRALVRATSDTSGLGDDVERVVGDLADPRSVARAAEGCAAIVHCGAMVSDWATVAELRAVNVEGTRAVARAAAVSGARLVHISTTDVYGHPGGAPVDERTPPARFANWYAQTKREAEAAVLASGADAVLLRPATVYGPGSREVIGEIATALRGGYMLLVGRGRTDAGLVHVDDLADAVLAALDAPPAARGQAFNVSDELGVTWRRLTDDLAAGLGCGPARLSLPYGVAEGLGEVLERGYRRARAATGVTVPALLSRQAVQVLGVDQRFANTKARAGLSWAPRVDYARGLASTLAWLRAAP
jgi:nucleoside-diphosphate-sugar epimerase